MVEKTPIKAMRLISNDEKIARAICRQQTAIDNEPCGQRGIKLVMIGIEKGRQMERERIFKKLEGCDVDHYGREWVGIACCKECWQALKEGKDV